MIFETIYVSARYHCAQQNGRRLRRIAQRGEKVGYHSHCACSAPLSRSAYHNTLVGRFCPMCSFPLLVTRGRDPPNLLSNNLVAELFAFCLGMCYSICGSPPRGGTSRARDIGHLTFFIYLFRIVVQR